MPLILPVKVEAQFGFFHAGSRDPLTVTPAHAVHATDMRILD